MLRDRAARRPTMSGPRRFRLGLIVLSVAAPLVFGCVSDRSSAPKPPCKENGCGASTAAVSVAQRTVATTPVAVRGIYASWPYASEYPTIAGLGFNAVSVEPWRDRLDYLQSLGLKGLVWLGGYDNSTCSFVRSDAWVTDRVLAVEDHPGVLAYEIDNEPHDYQCPTAPQQIKDRVSLVRSLIAPYSATLYITLSRDFSAFSGIGVDLIRISAYPCSYQYGCAMQKIIDKVAAARAAGFSRIWGGSQTAGDNYYRPPTPAELALIQQTWHVQGAERYVAWTWDGHGTTTPLRTNTTLWDAWKIQDSK